jgi:hypothetical protein
MTLFYLFPGNLFYLFPGNLSCCHRQTRGFSRLMRASLLFFFRFIKQACGGPIAASLLSRRR